MGCATSKLDDLPAVALCRDRCNFLHQAIQLRFAFAEAHLAYIHSLKLIGSSLHDFINQDGQQHDASSPTLNLPRHRKGDPNFDHQEDVSFPKGKHIHSHSNSGSHLNFHSDSDDDTDSDMLHHSGHSSPLHHTQIGTHNVDYGMIPTQDTIDMYPGNFPATGFTHMNFMKKHTTPSLVYQQTPYGEPSTSYQYSAYNSNPYPDYSGYYGGSDPRPYGSSMHPEASSSKRSPAPPSPPRASAWEFLNPFEGYDKYYSAYTPSRDSKELREEEGIPDLEDDNYQYQHEVVKEVHGRQKFVADGGGPKRYSKSVEECSDEDEHENIKNESASGGDASIYQPKSSVEYEAHVVEKKIVDNELSEDRGRSSGNVGRARVRDVSELAVEIMDQFERASEFGNEIVGILEVGKLPYHRKHVSKILHVVTPSISIVSSQPSTSKGVESSSDKANPAYLQIEDELAKGSKNLSTTLQKLHLWEKKLYNEVKAEEKMRVVHDRKCIKLKRLDQRGAEAHKVDSTQALIRSLSTKIRIAIQVVDKISVMVNKIRDDELWPQLHELIQGLSRMWKGMLKCHHTQSQAVREAINLGPLGSGKKLSDAHLEATLRLEHELLNWTFRFSSWITVQKGYVRALNDWLTRCLLIEPEETEDGRVPFSPGRIGAPPVFVICNQWSQALDRISEKEVVQSMRILAMGVFQLWEHDKGEMRQRMMGNKDLESDIKNLDRKDQRIQKEIQALDKKIVVVDGNDGYSLTASENIVFQSDTKSSSLERSLQHVFESMERFMAESMKAYEELLQRSEEETHAPANDGVS